jgi:hypothetical protein
MITLLLAAAQKTEKPFIELDRNLKPGFGSLINSRKKPRWFSGCSIEKGLNAAFRQPHLMHIANISQGKTWRAITLQLGEDYCATSVFFTPRFRIFSG